MCARAGNSDGGSACSRQIILIQNRGSEACWLPARDYYYVVCRLDSEIVDDTGDGSLC